jgi:hypothetical protein
MIQFGVTTSIDVTETIYDDFVVNGQVVTKFRYYRVRISVYYAGVTSG